MSRVRVVLVVMIGLLAGACQTELYRGLTQRDANEMTAILLRNGIQAKREPVDATTFRLTVPDEQFARAIEILRRTGYPRESYQSLGDVFKGDGLIVSPYEQRIRMMHAQNQELARTISLIDGVVSTRVHVVVPELDLRGAPQTKPTASVIVQHRVGVDTGELSTKIRLLVANGVQGLNYRDVSIGFFAAADGIIVRSPDMQTAVMNAGGMPALPGMPGSNTRGSGITAFATAPGAGAGMADALVAPPPETSVAGFVRTIVSLVLWGLAVLMALAGLAFLGINALGRSKATREAKAGEADKPAAKPA